MEFQKPQLCRVFEERKDASKFGNPRYGIQKKHDGWRLQVDDDKIWTGRNGTTRVIPFLKDIVPYGTRIDGEITDIEEKLTASEVTHLISNESEHHKLKAKIFDVTHVNGNFLSKVSLANRDKILNDIFNKHLRSCGRIELSEWLPNTDKLFLDEENNLS